MLLKIALLFMFISLSQAKVPTSVKVNGLEIEIDDHRLSSIIFQKTKIKAQRFDLISGVYQLGKYTYCKTMKSQMRCFIYLSNDLNGSFSSPWSDSEFGMTGFGYIHNKQSKTKAYFEEDDGNIYIWFSGKSAVDIFNQSAASITTYNNLNEEIRTGEHVSCKWKVKSNYSCILKLVLNDKSSIKVKNTTLELL